MAEFEDLLSAFPRAVGRGSHSILVEGLEVDVVPFGGVESITRRIAFPDGFELDVRGVAEAPTPVDTGTRKWKAWLQLR